MTRRILLTAAAGISAAALVAGGTKSANASAASKDERDEWRVFEAQTGKEIKWRDLQNRLSEARIIFMGEQHDDPASHRAERALLEAVFASHKNVTFALEMFERDQQTPLNDYLAGKIAETDLAKQAKLWPNYQTDYRPLIEFCKSRQIPVLASNAPARLVRRVGKEGLTAVLHDLSADDKKLIAGQIHAPAIGSGDAYAKRFAAVMSEGSGHGDGNAMPPETVQKFYEAQCVRDDTMAESVARLINENRTVLHLSGGFHVAAGLGTAQRFLWRVPLAARDMRVVQIIPIKGSPKPAGDKAEADYLLYVPDTRPDR